MILISIAAAIIPMSIYLLLLWKIDKYEPEPIKFVFFHFFWGATVAVIVGFAWSKLVSIPLNMVVQNTDRASFFQIILVAPFVEEISKGALLLRTIKNEQFNNLTDGLVYGGAIGLGFGMTENFLYFITFGSSVSSMVWLIIIRSVFSAVMHALATAAFGGLLSVSKYSTSQNRKILILVGIIISVTIHFIWNLSVSFSHTFFFGLFFMLLILGIFVISFIYSLSIEKTIIKQKLANEIPEEYIINLTSRARHIKGWFAESIRKEFINSAIKLAFRKHELEIDPGKREFYIYEIELLKTRVKELLKLNENKEDNL